MSIAEAQLSAFHLGQAIQKAQDSGDQEAVKKAKADWEQYKRGFPNGPSMKVLNAFNRGYYLPY